MARGSSSNGKRAGRPRRADGGRGGRRVVLAGRGDGWEVWIPEDDYQGMTEAERAAYVERQRALLDQAARASTERRPRRGPAIAGALDLAGALQLTLF